MYKILIVLLLFSCNKLTLKTYNLYKKSDISKANSLPTSQDFKKMKVAIVIKDKTRFNSKDINTFQIARSALENILKDLKNVEVLDRKFIEIIKREIDEETILSLSGIKKADYVILLTMDSITFNSKYNARSGRKAGYEALKFGTTLGVSAISPLANGGSTNSNNPIFGKYLYNAVFTGSLTIIKAKTLEKIGIIPLLGYKTDKESAQEFSTSATAKTYDSEIIRKSIVKAVNHSFKELVNYLPVFGFIFERKDYKENEPVLFAATFGTEDGVIMGDKVFLEFKKYDKNPFTDEEQIFIKEVKLGVVISNDLKDHSSWIKVKNKELSDYVKFGDKTIIYLKPKNAK